MQVLKLSPRSGWGWVIDGFRLLRRQPGALLMLVFLFLVSLTLPTIVPVVGTFLPLLLTPLLSFGLMCGFRAAEQGERPGPGVLFSALRGGRPDALRAMLMLGVVNALATALVLALTAAIDDGTLMRLVTGTLESDDPGLEGNGLPMAALLFLTLYLPLQMTLWYAPMFAVWHGVPAGKAMFFSFVAVWRNKAAFLFYLVGWMTVAVSTSLVLQVVRGAVAGHPLLASMILSPLSLVMLTALYGSIWASYRDPIRDDGSAAAA